MHYLALKPFLILGFVTIVTKIENLEKVYSQYKDKIFIERNTIKDTLKLHYNKKIMIGSKNVLLGFRYPKST